MPETEKMEKKVFISHSSKDAEQAMLICRALEDAGVGCWIAPRDIPYGSEWPEEIYDAIKNQCKIFVFLFSEYSNASRHCLREIRLADKFSGLPTLCIVTDNTEMNPNLEYYLANDQIMPVKLAEIGEKAESIAAETIKLMNKTGPQDADEEDDGFFIGEERLLRRFSYKSRWSGLIGRSEEMEFLRSFCTENAPLLSPLSWVAVYGDGGMGKSKLAYEFCKSMKNQGWKVFYPKSAAVYEEYFKKHIENIHCDTLFCFDYIKFELDAVNRLMKYAADRRSRYKVRFILIERDPDDIRYSFSPRIESCHYHGGDLVLHPLSELSIRDIIEDYVCNISERQGISEEDKDKIISLLKVIDPNDMRPLFVLFVTDAWLDGKIDDIGWDKESSVRYIAEKEMERIHAVSESLSMSAGEINPSLCRVALRFLVAYVTFVNQADMTELCEVSNKVFNLKDYQTEQLLQKYFGSSSESLKGIEPDLVGEYVCMDILNGMDEKYVSIFFDLMFRSYFYDMIAFLYKMDTDYPAAFSRAAWRKKASDLEIPQTVSYLKNGMFANCGFIETVHLHDQLTEIGKFVFRDCGNLTAINLPNSLETIGEAAFQNCVSLRDVVPADGKGWMPSVIAIGPRAFKNCKSLEEFTIPDSVLTLGTGAFEKCSSLKSILIPWNISCIEKHTFEDCTSLETIKFRTPKGVAIEPEAFRGCKALKNVIHSSRITEIGTAAFYHCESLISITLSAKLKKLDRKAFAKCFSLQTADLSGAELSNIASEAFLGCGSLQSVQLPEKLSSIRASAFRDCESLTDIRLPLSCMRIGEHAFLGCRQLTLSSFGDELPKIRDFCAFGIKKLSEEIVSFVTAYYDKCDLTLPKSVNRIADRAFKDDTLLENLTIPGQIKGIGEEAFSGCTGLRAIRGSFDSVARIGAAAFCSCRSLTELPAFSKIDTIPERAFCNCEKLDNVCIRSEVKQIGRKAFAGCTQLQWVDLVNKSSMVSALAFAGCDSFNLSKRYHVSDVDGKYYIGGFIFDRFEDAEKEFVTGYKDEEDVVIPSSCIGFFENPFAKLKSIRSITVPESVRRFIDYNFSDIPNLREITLPARLGYRIKEGFFAKCSSLSVFRIGKCEANTVPDGMKISGKAFDGCRSLTQIHLPETLQVIREATLRGCESLLEIQLPQSLKYIESAAFCGCSSLEMINIPPSVRNIGPAAFIDCISLRAVYGLELSGVTELCKEIFRGCISLRVISFPEALKCVSPYAFYDCKALQEVDLIGTEVCYIGLAAFQNCYMLKKMVIPVEVAEIQKFSFKSCTQLEEVILPPGIRSIGRSAFFGCNMLMKINTGDKLMLTEIGEYAFSGCHRLESFRIPENVECLSKGLFRYCTSLEKIELHARFTSIPIDCFYGCKQLKSITADAGIAYVGAGAFRNCYSLKDFSIFSDVEYVESAAFRACIGVEEAAFTKLKKIPPAMFMECHSLKTVSFPEVSEVGNYAFCDCEQLETAPIRNITTEIGLGAFWNCARLAEVSFSDTVMHINSSAFRGCNEIRSVELPESVSVVNATVFRGAEKLSSVIIPGSVERIKKSAFRDCPSLNTVRINSPYVEIDATAFSDCADLYYFSFADKLLCSESAFDGTPQKERLKRNQHVEWKSDDPAAEAEE